MQNIRSRVLDPVEMVLKVFVNSENFIKKRKEMIPAHMKYVNLVSQKKKVDDKLEKTEVEFQKLNSELKTDFHKFGQLCKEIGTLCLARFVDVMCVWYAEWQDKMNEVFMDADPEARNGMSGMAADFNEIVEGFETKFGIVRDMLPSRSNEFGTARSRISQSSQSTARDNSLSDLRAASIGSRPRGPSFASENPPRSSNLWHSQSSMANVNGSLYTASPISTTSQEMPHYDTRDPRYASRPGTGSHPSPEVSSNSAYWTRPGTSRSHTSNGPQRSASSGLLTSLESGNDESWFAPHINESFGLFNSAMPMDDTPLETTKANSSRRQSRTSSYHHDVNAQRSLKTLYMAASLFEFHFDGIKTEAGYPYLTYPAGDIFDVIAEKGELWLAKNNEDPTERIGWIWSKHFARFASTAEDSLPTEDGDFQY